MKLEALITPLTEAESLSRLRGAAEALGDWYKENARRLPWRERGYGAERILSRLILARQRSRSRASRKIHEMASA